MVILSTYYQCKTTKIYVYMSISGREVSDYFSTTFVSLTKPQVALQLQILVAELSPLTKILI